MNINLLFASMIGGILFASVVYTWHYPLLTTALLIFTLLIQLHFRPHIHDRKAMITAALLGTPAEAISVYLGEWRYHGIELVLGLPIWIPLVWANLFALYRRFTRSLLTLLPSSLFIGMGTLIAAYCFITLTLMDKMPIVYLLYAGFLIAMAGLWHQDEDLLIFLVGALLGTLGEYVCVQLGYWSYYHPYFTRLGVDITLSLDWGLSAVIINRIAEYNKRTE
ncbi:MAG: DUF2878 family protein [Magnetococcales bacterium]|nr:DUF2878 family protein [Magnetococcales bacterium]